MFVKQFKVCFLSQLSAFGQKSKVDLKHERSAEDVQKQNGVLSLVLPCVEASARPGAEGRVW